MKEKRKVECPVCGAYARDEGDLCSTARAVQGCLEESAWPTPTAGHGGGGLQARAGHRRPLSIHRATPSVELILCRQVGERARYTCGACGRQAMAEGLLCQPLSHGRR